MRPPSRERPRHFFRPGATPSPEAKNPWMEMRSVRRHLLLMCVLPLLCGAFSSAHAAGTALFAVPPEAPPEGVPPFPVPPVMDPPADAPPFGLPPDMPGFEPPVMPPDVPLGPSLAEIIVEVIHPREDEFGLGGPMLSFSFEPGVAPPEVPEVNHPMMGEAPPPIAAPEPGLLGLLTLAMLGAAGWRRARAR